MLLGATAANIAKAHEDEEAVASFLDLFEEG